MCLGCGGADCLCRQKQHLEKYNPTSHSDGQSHKLIVRQEGVNRKKNLVNHVELEHFAAVVKMEKRMITVTKSLRKLQIVTPRSFLWFCIYLFEFFAQEMEKKACIQGFKVST